MSRSAAASGSRSSPRRPARRAASAACRAASRSRSARGPMGVTQFGPAGCWAGRGGLGTSGPSSFTNARLMASSSRRNARADAGVRQSGLATPGHRRGSRAPWRGPRSGRPRRSPRAPEGAPRGLASSTASEEPRRAPLAGCASTSPQHRTAGAAPPRLGREQQEAEIGVARLGIAEGDLGDPVEPPGPVEPEAAARAPGPPRAAGRREVVVSRAAGSGAGPRSRST